MHCTSCTTRGQSLLVAQAAELTDMGTGDNVTGLQTVGQR